MNVRKSKLFAATLLAGMGFGLVAMAQPSPYDAAQLPETKGKVAQYLLTPMGMVDGLLLTDGTEVQVPPFASTELVFAVRPGDAVTIHGLKARALPMVAASSVTNDASGATVQTGAPSHSGMGAHMGMGEHKPGHGMMGAMHMMGGGNPLEVSGKVKAVLHNPRGETDGVLLEDGSQVRLPPPDAKRMAAALAPGEMVIARGPGTANLLGKIVVARQIGPDADHLAEVHGPRGMMGAPHDMMDRPAASATPPAK